MIFSSWQFLFVFLPVAMIGFFAIPEAWGKARKFWLTGASVVFYSYSAFHRKKFEDDFFRSRKNFLHHYIHLADAWHHYDNSGREPSLINKSW
jgi:hypothetical protein